MRKTIVLIIVSCMLAWTMAGCTSTDTNQATEAPTQPTKTESAATEPATTHTDEAVEIEIFMLPWTSVPIEGEDPYKEWLDELTGADWSLTYATDFTSELTTRAVAGDMPDLIGFETSNDLFSLYDEAILLDDWTPYLTDMPQTHENMGETAIIFYTKNDKLTCVTSKSGQQLDTFNIRTDWLSNLDLGMPTTPEELLDVARAFTFDDPDGNGENDTYGFTSAGGGGIGEIGNLGLMYGPTSYYITDDGEIANNITDGNLQKFLDYMRIIVEEKLIDPDWYTIGWDERKPNLYNGMYGISWYPSEALLDETNFAREGDGVVADWWEVLPMIDGSGDGSGGKLRAISPFGFIRTVSAQAAESEIKMDAITLFLETCAIPNREYYIFRSGVDIDCQEMTQIGSRVYIDGAAGAERGARKGSSEGQCLGLANYGKIINSYSPEANVIWGTTPSPAM